MSKKKKGAIAGVAAAVVIVCAAGAGNAARHVGFDQRAKVQILAGTLGFAIAAEIDAVIAEKGQ